MPAVRAHKRGVVAGMVDLNWNNLHGSLGDNFIFGEARFVAPRTVGRLPGRRIGADGSYGREDVYQSRRQTMRAAPPRPRRR